jgi:UDP-3-O-[3-hydroxymyristoyl] glucosamine N-acyltransferase
MATLIGDGSHARDILISCPQRIGSQVGHHSRYEDRGDGILIGINDPRLRARIAYELSKDDYDWVHPATTITDSRWGIGTHINAGTVIIRTRIGHHSTISPGVTICGDVRIGDRTLIGAGATICDRVTIGSDVTVGAGAVVLPETVIPDGETWIGVPARKKSSSEELAKQYDAGIMTGDEYREYIRRDFGPDVRP